MAGRHYAAWYCALCAKTIKVIRRPILDQLSRDIRYRGLPHPTKFQCADCGQSQAGFYEHRDYFKPAEVVPVCGSCNRHRGPALTVLNNVQHITLEAA